MPVEEELKALYGIGAASLSILEDEAPFVRQMGLTRDELTALLYQNLSAEEQAAGLPHDFFFNQPLPPSVVSNK